MKETTKSLSQILPSATPGEADLAAWQALPRDEQLRQLKSKLSHVDCLEQSAATMSDILGRAQAAAKNRHG